MKKAFLFILACIFSTFSNNKLTAVQTKIAQANPTAKLLLLNKNQTSTNHLSALNKYSYRSSLLIGGALISSGIVAGILAKKFYDQITTVPNVENLNTQIEELNKIIETNETKIRELKTNQQTNAENQQQLEKKLETQKKEKEELQAKAENQQQLKTEIKEKTEKITKLEKSQQEAKNTAISNQKNLKNLNEQIKKLEKNAQETTKKLNQITKEKEELQTTTTETNDKKEADLKEKENKITELNQNLTKLNTQLQTKTENQKQLEKRIENTKEDQKRLQDDLTKLKETYKNLELKKKKLTMQFNENVKISETLIKEKENLEKNIKDQQKLQVQITELKKKNEDLSKTKESLKEKIETISAISKELANLLAHPNYQTLEEAYKELKEMLKEITTEKQRLTFLNNQNTLYKWATELNETVTAAKKYKIIDLDKDTISPLCNGFLTLYKELELFDEQLNDLGQSIMLSKHASSKTLAELQGKTLCFKRIMYHINAHKDMYLERFYGEERKNLSGTDETRLVTIAEEIFTAIQRGAQEWNTLTKETKELSDQQITDLFWFMYSQGLNLSPVRSGPTEFSFVLVDTKENKGQILFNLLENHTKKYDRIASHLQEKVGFKDRKIYGLDSWTSTNELVLPMGMQTLLFMRAQHTEDKTGRYFYLFKPEKHSSKDLIKHGKDFVGAQTGKWLAKIGLTKSADDSLEYNKERIPKHITDQFGSYPLWLIPTKNTVNLKYIQKFYGHHEDLEYRIGNEIPINKLTDEVAQFYSEQKNNAQEKERLENIYRLRRCKTLKAIGTHEKTWQQDPVIWHNEVCKELYPEAYHKKIIGRNTKHSNDKKLLDELTNKIKKIENPLIPNFQNLNNSVFVG